ncbi:MAG: Rrf2 family transcriptional regulator [Chitinispirillaceae bacterium]|nr:Rrf2 family transcriptional regulator [Chitinispirillaceae bacterium]
MSTLPGTSQKCLYALHAMLHLAQQYPSESVVTVREIAARQRIPIRFLEQILMKLRIDGYVVSRRGKSGGYGIGKPPSALSIGDIIRSIDGPSASLRYNKLLQKDRCPMKGRCVFKGLWIRANTAIAEIFDKTTVQDMVDMQRKAGAIVDFSI